MMKLLNDWKQLVISGMCVLCLTAMPLMAFAYSAPQNSAQTQQMDKSNSDGSDTSKSDNPPPKPPPKPGPRDGGADD
jgi:hypothetical protein